MRLVNRFFKLIAYIGVYLLALIQSYLLSLIATPVCLCIACSVVSAFKALPEVVLTHFGLVYLVSSIPLAVIFFILIVSGIYDKYSTHSFKKM